MHLKIILSSRVALLDLPACLPDLNTIENLWYSYKIIPNITVFENLYRLFEGGSFFVTEGDINNVLELMKMYLSERIMQKFQCQKNISKHNQYKNKINGVSLQKTWIFPWKKGYHSNQTRQHALVLEPGISLWRGVSKKKVIFMQDKASLYTNRYARTTGWAFRNLEYSMWKKHTILDKQDKML